MLFPEPVEGHNKEKPYWVNCPVVRGALKLTLRAVPWACRRAQQGKAPL